MKKYTTKALAVLLAVIMCLQIFTAAGFATITYPSCVTESDASAALPKIESLAESLIKQNGGAKKIKQSIYAMLYDDATLNALFSGIYSAIDENASVLNMIGIEITPASLSQTLKSYSDISTNIAACASLADVVKASSGFKWGVKSNAQFSSAVAAMLSPMNELLYTLLCGGTYKVGVLISIKGDNGYTNAIVPMLNALKCEKIMTQEEFTASANKDRSNMVKNIFSSVFQLISDIVDKPVDELCEILPSAAYFLKNGGISEALTTLISPLQVKVAGLFSLGSVSSLIDSSEVFSNSSDLSEMLNKVDMSSLVDSDVDIKLPEIDLDAFASCGSANGDTFTSDKNAALIVLLRYLVDTIKLNKSNISSLVPAISGSTETINTFLNKSTDDLVSLMIKALTLSDTAGVQSYTWTYPEFTPGSIEYTGNLTKENYEKVINEIDDTLDEFMKEFTDKGSLSSILSMSIYSNKLITTLAKKLYGAIEDAGAADIMKTLGADITPSGVASTLPSKFSKAKSALNSAGSWSKLSDSTTWGFSDGSKSGFSSALTAVLSPFSSLLKFLLAEGTINLADMITVHGGNGYDTAIIPILEALGCNSDDIKTYSEYKSLSGDKLIEAITTPIINLLDRVVNKPVYTITSILPNIVYFINNDGIKQCVTNLLYPVTSLLKTLGLENMMPSELTNIDTTLDISSIVTELTSGTTLPIKLPTPDLNKAAALGTATTKTSKRTENGASAQYTYIEADQPAILVTALRYLVDALKTEDNAEYLSTALKSSMGDNEMMSMYTANIGEKLGAMTTDEVIEWLYKLLFSETPKKEETNEEDAVIPTVIYQPKEKTSNVTKGIIIAVVVIALMAIMVILGRVDFSSIHERSKHLKAKKKALKNGVAEKKQVAREKLKQAKQNARQKAPSPYVEPVQNTSPDSKPMTEAEQLNSYSRLANEAEIRRARAEAEGDAVAAAKARRELVRLSIRQDKAIKRLQRQSRKADKYYQKAVKERDGKNKQ